MGQLNKNESADNRALTLRVLKKAKQGTFFQGVTTNQIPVPIFGAYHTADNYKKLHILQNQLAANGIAIFDTFICNAYTRTTYAELTASDDGKFVIVYVPSGATVNTNRMCVTIECLEFSYGSLISETRRTTFAAGFIQLFLPNYVASDSNTTKYLDNFDTFFAFDEISNLGSRLEGQQITLNSSKNPNETQLNITSLPCGLELNGGTAIIHNIKHDDAIINYNFKMN